MDSITCFDRMSRVAAGDICNRGHASFVTVDGTVTAIDIGTLAIAFAGTSPDHEDWTTVRFELVSPGFRALLEYEVPAGTDVSSVDWLLAFALERPGWSPCSINPDGSVTFPSPAHFSNSGDWPLHHLLRVLRAENESSREFALPMPEASLATQAWNNLCMICPDESDIEYLVVRAVFHEHDLELFRLLNTPAETSYYPLYAWSFPGLVG